MGLFSKTSTCSGRSTSGAAAKHHHAAHSKPSESEMQQLVADMRTAFGDDLAVVERQLTSGGEEGLTDAQLKRWLAARGYDPARAAHDLAAHAAWRADFVPNGRVSDAEVQNELLQRKVLIQGLDRHGRAVAVLVGGNHIPRPDLTEVMKFFCYSADAAIQLADPVLNPAGKLVFILDVCDFGFRNWDIAGAKMLFKMIHAHYVERLAVLYFHNASTVVQQLYRLVSSFIDPATREKIVFLPHDPQESAAILEKDIDLALLPPSLGGTSEPRPVESAWVLLEERRRQQQQQQQPQQPAMGQGPSSGEVSSGEVSSGEESSGEDAVVAVDVMRQGSMKQQLALEAPIAAQA